MQIREVIRYHRKKENLTQEQVANYLNISAPAVNKWESGISYPDITLLAPLARVLKIDVNTLLAFNQELTDVEIKSLTREVGEMASKEGLPKAFEKAMDLIKQYSNCDELILNISTVLRIYMLAVTDAIEKDKFERKIIAWLEFAAASSKENKLSEAEEYIERAKKLVEVFDLGAYHKHTLDLSLAKEKQDKEKAIETIVNMVNEADTMDNSMKSKLYKHRKLNVTNSWGRDKYEKLVKESIKKDKTLDFVKNDPKIKLLLDFN